MQIIIDFSQNIKTKIVILPNIWDINSVGLECYLDRVEVTGSNPVYPTK